MKKIIVSSGSTAIDCSSQPKVPKKLVLKEHGRRSVVNFNLSDLKAISVASKLIGIESFIYLEEAIKRFRRNRKYRPVNANILDYLKTHYSQIPKKFSKPGVYLLFLETTYLNKKRELCVRALNYSKDGWYETIVCSGDTLAGNDLVICA